MKIPIYQCYNTLDDRVECWYAQHGHDHPDYLPYWVRYMPEDLRLYYLNKEGKMFKDFTQDMLHRDFNWKQWKHY